jgi:hypothetical protein
VFLAANVGFISFHNITKQVTATSFLDTVANALQHKPGGLLSDVEILGKLDRRDTFFERGVEINSIEPFL